MASNLPFPVSGIVYDFNGTTAVANTRVICNDVTTNESLTTTTNSSGQFIFDLSNLTSGYTIGDEISLFTSYGNYYEEIVFTVSGTSKSQDLTLAHLIESAAMYCSVTDIRRFTAVGTSDMSDDALYDMIRRVTGEIDERTGRTWKGIQTVTDEYYDGDDTDILWMNNTDLQSITALSIDDNADGTYTDITLTRVYVYSNGYIVLDRNAEITSFVAAGPKSVKVSYTYGNSAPSQTIKELCILMVANLMHYDARRADMIERIFQRERWSVPGGLY